MRRTLNHWLAVLFVVFCISGQAWAAVELPLWAGQTAKIGQVTIENNAISLIVTFQLDVPGWLLGETHVYAGIVPPSKSAPGQFPYKDPVPDSPQLHVYTIPLSDFGGATPLYIAAHADVQNGTVPGVPCPPLPVSCWVQVACPGPLGMPSYFDLLFSQAGLLDGLHDGWCLDTELPIGPHNYLTYLYCSYDPAAAALVDDPENLPNLNFLANKFQEYLDQGYAWQSIQRAIWHLLDDNPTEPDPYLAGEDPAQVFEILGDALDNGDNFIPGPGQLIVILLDPVGQINHPLYGTRRQPMMITLPARFGEETAWALGCNGVPFWEFRTGWGGYIRYNVQP